MARVGSPNDVLVKKCQTCNYLEECKRIEDVSDEDEVCRDYVHLSGFKLKREEQLLAYFDLEKGGELAIIQYTRRNGEERVKLVRRNSKGYESRRLWALTRRDLGNIAKALAQLCCK